jgi:pimeloyl-ACP methyl ester carboxylesterase
MSTSVLFFPGLQGHKQFEPGYPKNEQKGFGDHLKQFCDESGGFTFVRVDYQTKQTPFPLVSAMGDTAEKALKAAGQDMVAVGSSVGAGALLQGLGQHLKNGGKPPTAIILIGPVYDPITAVETLAGKAACDALAAGQIPAIPVPVSAAQGQADPGAFYMSKAHMADAAADRIFKAGPHSSVIQMIKQHNIPVVIFTAEQDSYSPPLAALGLMQLLSRPAKGDSVHLWAGGHNGETEQRFEDVKKSLVSLATKATPTARPKPAAPKL